jgi:hypothetical protein
MFEVMSLLTLLLLLSILAVEAVRLRRCTVERSMHQVDLDQVADRLTLSAISEFKTDNPELLPLRQWAFTQYTILCAEWGLPRSATEKVVRLMEQRLYFGLYEESTPDEDGNMGNFLFDGVE